MAESITLRRTKVDVGILPPIEVENHFIQLSGEELVRYEITKDEADVALLRYLKNKLESGPQLLPYLQSLLIILRLIVNHSPAGYTRLQVHEDFEGNIPRFLNVSRLVVSNLLSNFAKKKKKCSIPNV